MAEREHGGDPSSGCGIGRGLGRRPPTSQRSRRSPELHHWLKRTRRFREKEPATRPAGGPSRSNCAAPESSAPRQGIKNTPSRQPEMAEREHGGDPSSGCGIGRGLGRRPPTSQRSRRSPELHHWLKRTRRFREKEPATRPAGGPSRSNCAAPESSAPPPRDKEHTISPAGNGGERARRRPIFGLWNWAGPWPKTPYLAALAPIARAPSLAKKNTTISRKRTGDAASRRPEPVKLRRAGIVGTPAKG